MEESALRKIAENVKSELSRASHKQSSSFPFISTPLRSVAPSTVDIILVLVIGGSVFKKAVFTHKNDELVLQSSSEKPQIPFHSKTDFLEFVEQEIDKDITHIAVNFAYPVTPILRENRLDGILLNSMKENRFAGLIGEAIGRTIEEYVNKKRGQTVKVTLANDTICLLLSGSDSDIRSKLSAMVIGTGLNLAFFADEGTAVNLEAANFDKFSPSVEVLQLDQDSASPGKALFEKEISGGYLFEQYNRKMQTLNPSFRRIYSTKELDIIASSTSKKGAVAREILVKSAQLSACLLAGLTLYKNTDMTCVMEGSLFWKGHQYKQTFEKTLSLLLPTLAVTLVKIPQSPLIGAARLV